MKFHNYRFAAPILFILGLVICLFVYWPALTGPFVFDDIPNLQSLGQNGGINSFDNLRRFIFSGVAGPMGRPLSLLTFVINDQAWPSDAWSFKYTNLLLHLLTGVLVFVFVRQLGKIIQLDKEQIDSFAALVMMVWLLHPIQLSTIMLVVQRMTILCALFTMCGVISYLHGRLLAPESESRGYVWMTVGVACTIPAILSKENGILLPLLLLCLEGTVIRTYITHKPKYWRLWTAAFLIAPVALLLLYFAYTWPQLSRGYALRDFTMSERLLTEPRILVDYLRLILLPRLHGVGVFHDDYPWSTGIISPLSTIICIFLFIFSTSAAVVCAARRKAPIVAFAILWFLAGHALESSFLGLELYFEHRNYLPLLGPMVALVFYVFKAGPAFRVLGSSALTAFIILEIFVSTQSSITWSNELLLANTWAAENPKSVRAQQYVASLWVDHGHIEKARDALVTAERFNPDETTVKLQLLILDCLQSRPLKDRLINIVQNAPYGSFGSAAISSIETLREDIRVNTCPELGYENLHEILHGLLKNPKYTYRIDAHSGLYFLDGSIYAQQRRLNEAMDAFDNAYRIQPSVEIALIEARLLLSAGLKEPALEYVEIARKTPQQRAWLLPPTNPNINDVERMIRQQQ